MSARRFTLDTNVLVYAADRRAGEKHERALLLVDRAVESDCVLTIQALAEFFSVVTREVAVARSAAAEQVRDWLALFPTTTASDVALDSAVAAAAQGRLAFWDALLLATAREADCAVVLSEDMQDGASLEGVTIRNPFGDATIPEEVKALLGLS